MLTLQRGLPLGLLISATIHISHTGDSVVDWNIYHVAQSTYDNVATQTKYR